LEARRRRTTDTTKFVIETLTMGISAECGVLQLQKHHKQKGPAQFGRPFVKTGLVHAHRACVLNEQ